MIYKVGLALMMVVTSNPMQHQRVNGQAVSQEDKKAWHRSFPFQNGDCVVDLYETVAVYHKIRKEWIYAQVLIKPNKTCRYWGLATFALNPRIEYYKNFALKFGSRGLKKLAEPKDGQQEKQKLS